MSFQSHHSFWWVYDFLHNCAQRDDTCTSHMLTRLFPTSAIIIACVHQLDACTISFMLFLYYCRSCPHTLIQCWRMCPNVAVGLLVVQQVARFIVVYGLVYYIVVNAIPGSFLIDLSNQSDAWRLFSIWPTSIMNHNAVLHLVPCRGFIITFILVYDVQICWQSNAYFL